MTESNQTTQTEDATASDFNAPVMPQYFLRSKYCGTLVYAEPMTYEEAERERDNLNQEAVDAGFEEVQYEIIEA